MAEFEDRKRRALATLACADKSRKGALDAPIASLVAAINSHPDYFTTSSCSGRITLFSEEGSMHSRLVDQTVNKVKKKKKKGGDWLLVCHELVNSDEVLHSVQNTVGDIHDSVMFRFEPFILALDCSTVSAAQELVACAIGSGFRESGITSISKRIIVAIRCSIRLEVPVIENGRLLVSEDYLNFLSVLANRKMEQNRQRTDRFLTSFVTQFQPSVKPPLIDTRIEVTNDDHFGLKEVATMENNSPKSTSTKEPPDYDLYVVEEVEEITDDGSDESEESGIFLQLDSSKEDAIFYSSAAGQKQVRINDEYSSASPAHQAKGEDIFLLKASEPGVSERLQRWGHSSSTLMLPDGKFGLLVVGGYGNLGRHGRLNDLLLINVPDLSILKSTAMDVSRMAHTATNVGDEIWIIGGRQGPTTLLEDILVVECSTLRSYSPQVRHSATCFPLRHRHAAASVGKRIFVFGGLGASGVLGDVVVLDTISMEWCVVESKGDIPCARYSHSLCSVDEKLYLFGGCDGKEIYGDLFMMDTANLRWTKLRPSGQLPVARFSHSATVVGKKIVVIGGCPTVKQMNSLFVLDTVTLQWNQISLLLPDRCLLVRHTANFASSCLFVVGGGASCYAFGTHFSTSFALDMTNILHNNQVHGDGGTEGEGGVGTGDGEGDVDDDGAGEGEGVVDADANGGGGAAAATGDGDGGGGECGDGEREGEGEGGKRWALQIDRTMAKAGKDVLKKLGWLDRSRRVEVSRDGCHVSFPVLKGAVSELQLLLRDGKCRGNLVMLNLDCNRKMTNPHIKLENAVALLLKDKGYPPSLTAELPQRWERVGDMGILPSESLRSSVWRLLGNSLWETIASAIGVRRLARQGRIAATETRDSGLEMLIGEDGWVEHRENGIFYCFDSTKCMFSSGNVSERMRMGNLDCEKEVVVDLFAGIGYFVLPFLLRSNAKRVYACEWNPHALYALRRNLHVNGVEANCTVIEGDNRLTAPQGIAHRICLGLLPSSQASWGVAVSALRPEGGMLHVHENVKDVDEHAWVKHLIDSIRKLSAERGRLWDVIQVDHVEHVKWYAPHIRHVVADVRCQ